MPSRRDISTIVTIDGVNLTQPHHSLDFAMYSKCMVSPWCNVPESGVARKREEGNNALHDRVTGGMSARVGLARWETLTRDLKKVCLIVVGKEEGLTIHTQRLKGWLTGSVCAKASYSKRRPRNIACVMVLPSRAQTDDPARLTLMRQPTHTTASTVCDKARNLKHPCGRADRQRQHRDREKTSR